jgi:hypothetical protein
MQGVTRQPRGAVFAILPCGQALTCHTTESTRRLLVNCGESHRRFDCLACVVGTDVPSTLMPRRSSTACRTASASAVGDSASGVKPCARRPGAATRVGGSSGASSIFRAIPLPNALLGRPARGRGEREGREGGGGSEMQGHGLHRATRPTRSRSDWAGPTRNPQCMGLGFSGPRGASAGASGAGS